MAELGLKLRLKKITADISSIYTNGLRMWHRFIPLTWDGTTKLFKDSTNNSNDVELYAGYSLEFDGANDSVEFGDIQTEIRTLVFYASPFASTYPFMQLQSSGSVNLISTNGQLTASGWSSPSYYVNGASSSTISIQTWQQIAVTSDTPISVSDFRLGFQNYSYYRGGISDVKFFSNKLTANNIAELYALPERDVPTGVSSDNLVGWWKILESANINVIGDYSGNSKSGTVIGATVGNRRNRPVPQNYALKRQGIVSLNGTGYMQALDADSLDITDSITLEAWVWWDTTGSAEFTVMSKNLSYSLELTGSNPQLSIWQSSTVRNRLRATNVNLLSNKWYHLVATYTASAAKLYVDGDIITTSAAISNSILVGTNPVLIGSSGTNNPGIIGRIGQVRIYSEVLDDYDVLNNYNSQKHLYKNLKEFDDWKLNNTDSYNFVNAFHNVTSNQSLTYTLIGSITQGGSKYYGGALAPNGKIYSAPFDATSVIEIDTNNDTISTFGLFDSGFTKWTTCTLAPNGKIYAVPHTTASVLEIDPYKKTTRLIGEDYGNTTTTKWINAVLAPNGKIYGIPFNHPSVLEIDPSSGTTTTFGYIVGASKWGAGSLGPDGKIYCVPHHFNDVLIIDPYTKTLSQIPANAGTSTAKYRTAITAPNGKIYGIPWNQNSILEIDPIAKSAITLGSMSGTGGTKWLGGTISADGNIHAIPFSSTASFIFNPITRELSIADRTFIGTGAGTWAGGVLAPNGIIYTIPYNSTGSLKILSENPISSNLVLSRFINKGV